MIDITIKTNLNQFEAKRYSELNRGDFFLVKGEMKSYWLPNEQPMDGWDINSLYIKSEIVLYLTRWHYIVGDASIKDDQEVLHIPRENIFFSIIMPVSYEHSTDNSFSFSKPFYDFSSMDVVDSFHPSENVRIYLSDKEDPNSIYIVERNKDNFHSVFLNNGEHFIINEDALGYKAEGVNLTIK